MRMKREMKMRWKWRWNESYLTGTRDGERKKGEEEPRENTNTNTPCPERANPEKAREKKKRRPTEEHQDKRRGGKDGRAWTNLTPAKTKPTWAHTEPNLPGEGSTHEIGDPWGPSWLKTKTNQKGIQFGGAKFVRYSHYGTAVDQPELGIDSWQVR